MEYKYRKSAGALNEAADVRAGAPAGRVVPPPPPASMASLSDAEEDYVSAHRTDSGRAFAAADAYPRMRHDESRAVPRLAAPAHGHATGLETIHRHGSWGMFFHTIREGQRVLVTRRNGRMEVVEGPRRVFWWGKTIEPMAHHVAHPGEFLIVRFRDGRQEHLAGPDHVWVDPRVHLSIEKEDALQISAKEAVVVYARDVATAQVTRRIVHGPATFVPAPGEWLHTFSWHGSRGGEDGYQKVPNGLVFQKLWLMPDQMYHDVHDVRTADDAVLTIRLMIFFELSDVARMLDTSHDPIGDFVNAATSDVVAFVGRHDFEGFKKATHQLNELATYPQLVGRAGQCGYRIDKIVYRGYGAPGSLQRMHDEAIESRTRLQLERATQEQAQDLEDFKLQREQLRAARHRTDQEAQTTHEIAESARRQEAALRDEQARRDFARAQAVKDAQQEATAASRRDEVQRQHLSELKTMGVDLTALLTQGRADRVIELRGQPAGTHVHLEPTRG